MRVLRNVRRVASLRKEINNGFTRRYEFIMFLCRRPLLRAARLRCTACGVHARAPYAIACVSRSSWRGNRYHARLERSSSASSGSRISRSLHGTLPVFLAGARLCSRLFSSLLYTRRGSVLVSALLSSPFLLRHILPLLACDPTSVIECSVCATESYN